MNTYHWNIISIAAVVILFLAVLDYWIDFTIFGQVSLIAAGIYGICLNLHALMRMRNNMNG